MPVKANYAKYLERMMMMTILTVNLYFSAEWLLRIAPHYYDVRSFPPCEARDKFIESC
jgi:hypothetical protein